MVASRATYIGREQVNNVLRAQCFPVHVFREKQDGVRSDRWLEEVATFLSSGGLRRFGGRLVGIPTSAIWLLSIRSLGCCWGCRSVRSVWHV